MATTYLSGATEVAERTQDTSTAHITRCKDWLNQIYREIASKHLWSWLEASTSFNTSASDYDYALSSVASDLARIRIMRIESSPDFLDAIPPDEFDMRFPKPTQSTGQPLLYTVWAGNVRLWPTPDATYSIKVDYWKTTTDLSADGDEPLIPERFRWVWLKGAEFFALRFNDDARAQLVLREYERGISDMLANETRYMGGRMFFAPFTVPSVRFGVRYPPHSFPR